MCTSPGLRETQVHHVEHVRLPTWSHVAGRSHVEHVSRPTRPHEVAHVEHVSPATRPREPREPAWRGHVEHVSRATRLRVGRSRGADVDRDTCDVSKEPRECT